MTDNSSKKTSPSGTVKRAPKRQGKSGKGNSARSSSSRINRTAPLHQARIFAMQSLFEDGLTDHELDDVLQQIGVQVLNEHRDYFSRVSADAAKGLDELTFLARNTDRSESGPPYAHFTDARDKLLPTLFQAPDDADRDLTEDTLELVRSASEQRIRKIITDFSKGAMDYLEMVHFGEQDAIPGTSEHEEAERRRIRYLHDVVRRIESFRPAEDSATAVADKDATESSPPAPRDWDSLSADDYSLRDLELAAAAAIRREISRDEQASRKTLMDIMSHTRRLAKGVTAHQEEIDAYIADAAPAFPIPQLASVDRAVLRLAIFELLYEPNVPFKAAINEAVEIAKRYGGPNSGKFVNGVLRTISERIHAQRAQAANTGN